MRALRRWTILLIVLVGLAMGVANACALQQGGALRLVLGEGGQLAAREQAHRLAQVPASLGTSCPVAASLALWEWNSVQPAARALLGAEARHPTGREARCSECLRAPAGRCIAPCPG
jgi:hypothetical protein